MHVDALGSPVEGRPLDPLAKEPLARARVVPLVRRPVVVLDRPREHDGLDVHGGRHRVDRVRLPHDAVDELDAERRSLEGTVVRDHPAAPFGKRQNGVRNHVPGTVLVDESPAVHVDVDVGALIVEQASAPERKRLKAEARRHERAVSSRALDEFARCPVKDRARRIGARRNVGREQGIDLHARLDVGREAPAGDDEASRPERSCALRRFHFDNPRMPLGSEARHGRRERKPAAEAPQVRHERKHVAAARRVARHRVALGLLARIRDERFAPEHAEALEPVEHARRILADLREHRRVSRAAADLERILDEPAERVVRIVRARGRHGRNRTARIDRMSAHERPLFKNQHAARARLQGCGRSREPRRTRARDDHVPDARGARIERVGRARGKKPARHRRRKTRARQKTAPLRHDAASRVLHHLPVPARPAL